MDFEVPFTLLISSGKKFPFELPVEIANRLGKRQIARDKPSVKELKF